MTDLIKFSVSSKSILDTIEKCKITHVTTVPDYAQLSLQIKLEEGYLPNTRVIRCSAEDQAIECAAGLWIGGKKPIVIMQNQGFYASINSIRAVGIDAKLPLVLMIGPWGREFSNLGQSMRQSNRKVISMLEPMMDVLGIRYWNLESSKDLGVIPEAIDHAFSESKPTAILVGAYTAWN